MHVSLMYRNTVYANKPVQHTSSKSVIFFQSCFLQSCTFFSICFISTDCLILHSTRLPHPLQTRKKLTVYTNIWTIKNNNIFLLIIITTITLLSSLFVIIKSFNGNNNMLKWIKKFWRYFSLTIMEIMKIFLSKQFVIYNTLPQVGKWKSIILNLPTRRSWSLPLSENVCYFKPCKDMGYNH